MLPNRVKPCVQSEEDWLVVTQTHRSEVRPVSRAGTGGQPSAPTPTRQRSTVQDHLPPEALASKLQNTQWCLRVAQHIGPHCLP